MNTLLKRIYGLEYEEIFSDDYLIWKTFIHKPFRDEKGRWKIGINEKFLKEAVNQGVERILVQVGQQEIQMKVPTEKELKRKDRKKEFQLKPSLFENSPPLKIYWFIL